MVEIFGAFVIGGLVSFLVGYLWAGLPTFWFKKKVWCMGHMIEIKNNMIGMETILVDDRIVSHKFGLFKSSHHIMIDQYRVEVIFKLNYTFTGVRNLVYVNGNLFLDG